VPSAVVTVVMANATNREVRPAVRRQARAGVEHEEGHKRACGGRFGMAKAF
jgi:hypothetical protein